MFESTNLDQTGKIVLDQIYNKSTPTTYFTTLSRLKYQIPQVAKPVFRKIIEEYRMATGKRRLRIVDIGCSYGINAALLKYNRDMSDLYAWYSAPRRKTLGREALLEQDHAYFDESDVDHSLEFVGLDTADRAIAYAVEAGILDDGVAIDLEREQPGEDEHRLISGADLVISTGCVGYVGAQTFRQILLANQDRQPWFANFVLRMFSISQLRSLFKEQGYLTEKADGAAFTQREFASREERDQVFRRLDELGVEPIADERRGWLSAEFFLSRPAGEARARPLAQIMSR